MYYFLNFLSILASCELTFLVCFYLFLSPLQLWELLENILVAAPFFSYNLFTSVSAHQTGIPRSLNIFDMVVFPIPMDPVKPRINLGFLFNYKPSYFFVYLRFFLKPMFKTGNCLVYQHSYTPNSL